MSTKSYFLIWTYYRTLLRENDDEAREWYLQEAINEGWGGGI